MIRLGIIGYGLRSAYLISNSFYKIDPDGKVAAIVDQNETAARARLEERDKLEVKFYKSLDEMVRNAKIDGIIIGTRCNTHTKYAIEAAKYDIPLFLEKPVAISMTQATALEKAFKKSRCKVVVSFPLRVSPLCQFAKNIIQDSIKEPQHIHAVNFVTYGTVYWEEEYRNYEITGGLFLQKATHDFDYISFLMGSPIVRVGAMANYGRVFGGNKPGGLVCSKCAEQDICLESPKNRSKYNPADERLRKDHPCLFSKDCGSPKSGTNEDCSSALFEFASGAHGVYSQVFFSRNEAANRGATISGYNGTVSFDWYKNELKHIRHHVPLADTSKVSANMNHFGGDDMLVKNFLDVISCNAESKTPIQIGIQSVYACLAARTSANTGQFVKVRQV